MKKINTGFIYRIVNSVNTRIYVGVTSRDITTRFYEHCFTNDSTSIIHSDIQTYGWQKFHIEEIEEVPLKQLFERQQYWINFYKASETGYNQIQENTNSTSDLTQILVVEPNIIFKSKEQMIKEISTLTKWNHCDKLLQNNLFLDYHIQEIHSWKYKPSSVEDRENWIKILNRQYEGKHLYCPELNKNFYSVAHMATYLIDAGYSKASKQSIITAIARCLNEKADYVKCIEKLFTVYTVPGEMTELIEEKPVYCQELSWTFNSQSDAADYMTTNHIWQKIKAKTAKRIINDLIQGNLTDYQGYHFSYGEENI